MENLFLKLLNMGIAAGWVILAVLLLRILLKKAPKTVRCALWILVGIRLVCPFSIESVLSLIPSQETSSVQLQACLHSGSSCLGSCTQHMLCCAFRNTIVNCVCP